MRAAPVRVGSDTPAVWAPESFGRAVPTFPRRRAVPGDRVVLLSSVASPARSGGLRVSGAVAPSAPHASTAMRPALPNRFVGDANDSGTPVTQRWQAAERDRR